MAAKARLPERNGALKVRPFHAGVNSHRLSGGERREERTKEGRRPRSAAPVRHRIRVSWQQGYPDPETGGMRTALRGGGTPRPLASGPEESGPCPVRDPSLARRRIRGRDVSFAGVSLDSRARRQIRRGAVGFAGAMFSSSGRCWIRWRTVEFAGALLDALPRCLLRYGVVFFAGTPSREMREVL